MMKTNHKKAGVVAAAVGSALLVGGGALAFADTGAPTPGADGDERGESSFAGTIKAPAENKSDAAALAKLATVTEQEATKAATDLVPGTISKIALDDEDGFVVWEVDITTADGTMVEVLVDAGNVGNTAQESEDADEVAIVGTIRAPAENESGAADGSPEERAQDQAEAAALAALATVTEQEASRAATDAVPGTLTRIALDDEDGFVVWEADITRADGTRVEVLVDAGNASILAQQVD